VALIRTTRRHLPEDDDHHTFYSFLIFTTACVFPITENGLSMVLDMDNIHINP
jgi:hypothetical protein